MKDTKEEAIVVMDMLTSIVNHHDTHGLRSSQPMENLPFNNTADNINAVRNRMVNLMINLEIEPYYTKEDK